MLNFIKITLKGILAIFFKKIYKLSTQNRSSKIWLPVTVNLGYFIIILEVENINNSFNLGVGVRTKLKSWDYMMLRSEKSFFQQ